MNAQNLNFGIASVLAVVGYDPEMADVDHPRGEIVREVFSVGAEAADGRRWNHDFSSLDRAVVERLLARIEAAVAAGRALDDAHWVEGRPVYGSEAYIAQGVDHDDWMIERREAGIE